MCSYAQIWLTAVAMTARAMLAAYNKQSDTTSHGVCTCKALLEVSVAGSHEVSGHLGGFPDETSPHHGGRDPQGKLQVALCNDQ